MTLPLQHRPFLWYPGQGLPHTLCEHSQQSNRQIYWTPKLMTLPSHISPACPPIPSYHLLGFGRFTAESNGLPSGQVLGEMTVEHTEAARVHLAYGHFCLVPWSGRKGLWKELIHKSLVSLLPPVTPTLQASCASKAALVSLLLLIFIYQVTQGSQSIAPSIHRVG